MAGTPFSPDQRPIQSASSPLPSLGRGLSHLLWQFPPPNYSSKPKPLRGPAWSSREALYQAPHLLSLNRIVVLNLALVSTHQVDAAYWREWEMFELPGGIQLFNALNVVIFLVVLSCFVAVVQRRPSG